MLFKWCRVFICVLTILALTTCAQGQEYEGLYHSGDNVITVTGKDYLEKLFHKSYGQVVQFYNSYCGHCQVFAPVYKQLAATVLPWRRFVRLAAVDCSVDENAGVCRDFDIVQYPEMRYLHENFPYLPGYTGQFFASHRARTKDDLMRALVDQLQAEQAQGRMQGAPSLELHFYRTRSQVINNLGSQNYVFIVFESAHSKVGSELILHTNDFPGVRVMRVHESSPLAFNERRFPAMKVMEQDNRMKSLTPLNPTFEGLLYALNNYLSSHQYSFPKHRKIKIAKNRNGAAVFKLNGYPDSDDAPAVYYNDIELALKTALFIELPRLPVLSGESLTAAVDFLGVISRYFPWLRNSDRRSEFIQDLRDLLMSKEMWTGNEIDQLFKQRARAFGTVFPSNLQFIGCKGSKAQYRGYPCGLWSLFHTLTVAAEGTPGGGVQVLRAMYGFIKNIFGCTECAQNFVAMAAKNRLLDVKDNKRAVLWLWVAHNEVNLRLSGAAGEDPTHPKAQFPATRRCGLCRASSGRWRLPLVLGYLRRFYQHPILTD